MRREICVMPVVLFTYMYIYTIYTHTACREICVIFDWPAVSRDVRFVCVCLCVCVCVCVCVCETYIYIYIQYIIYIRIYYTLMKQTGRRLHSVRWFVVCIYSCMYTCACMYRCAVYIHVKHTGGRLYTCMYVYRHECIHGHYIYM